MGMLLKLIEKWNQLSLVKRIVIGLVVGIILALVAPEGAGFIANFGTIFISFLRAVAPILVFFLVMAALAQHKAGRKTNIKSIIVLYIVGTVCAAFTAVIANALFPVTLQLVASTTSHVPPSGVMAVLKDLIMKSTANPLEALVSGNYIGILFWAVLLGLAFQRSSENFKIILGNIADGVTQVVKWVINLAPFGVMGLVFSLIESQGLVGLGAYGKLLFVLLGCMLFVALVVNPLIAFIMIRTNPYPLVLKCLRESGITAFFTRSSAANIPVNMNLCEELKLHKDTYSVSIPLGATINMAGAAVTITTLTLSATHTLGIQVDFVTVILLSILASVSACGSSGVPSGSLLLTPLACSLFGIPNDIAMQVVAVGFIVSVLQDSCETGLNSSTDVLFTAVAEYRQWRKNGKGDKILNKFFSS
jgi:serine/threonine transporter